MHVTPNEYSIRLAQKIGVRWQRQFGDLTWSSIELERGRFELETPLENLRRFGKYKIMVLPNLGMPPAWARGGEGHERPHNPTNWEDYRKYLQKIMTTFDIENLGGWETYNEPNLDYKGSPEQNARDAFFEYSKRTYEILKPLTKKPIVNQVSAANFEDGWMKDMLDRGISKYADELSYHYYISGSDPLENNFGQKITEWNAQMKTHGKILPLEMTEGFVSGNGAIGTWYEYMPKVLTGTVLDNAVLNIRSFIGTWALGVKRSFPYHAYGDSPRYGETASSDLWGGFLEGDGVPLPVMSAYAVMTSQLEDMTYVQSGKVAGSVSYHVFRGPAGIVAVAWDDGGVKRKVSLPLQVLGATSFMGNAAAFENKGNATMVTIDRAPIYLKLKELPAKSLGMSLTPPLPVQSNEPAASLMPKPKSSIKLTGRDLTFTFSGAPASLHTKITGQIEPARVGVYLPADYAPSRTYPLLILLEGAEGSLGTDTGLGRSVADNAGFIIANLPSYKENVPPLDNNAANRWGRMFISQDDAPHILSAYGPMLERLFTEFPNIDRKRTVFGGFSNGANTTSALLSNPATASEFLKYFRHFVLVEGGWRLEPAARMEGCSAIVLHGGLRKTGGLEAMAERLRQAGANVTHGVMPGVEHYFSDEGKKQVATWLQGLARPTAPSSP